jgi:hypothetical protein
VRKEPLHGSLAVRVARREQRLLAPDQREAHALEHAESGLVEGRQAGEDSCSISEAGSLSDTDRAKQHKKGVTDQPHLQVAESRHRPGRCPSIG